MSTLQGQKEEPLDEHAMEKIKSMHMAMARLRIFMIQQDIEQAGKTDILGKQLSCHAQKKLQELVSIVAQLCVETIKYDGVDICAMVSANSAQCWNIFADGMAPWSTAEPEMWIELVKSLTLRQDQIDQILVTRMEFLSHLAELFEQRQKLNGEVLKLLAKLSSVNKHNNPELTSSPVDNFRAFPDQKYELSLRTETNQIYDQLKLNLKREQALYTIMDRKLMQILTYVQESFNLIAWGMLTIYPEHCDCLALVNAVYEAFAKKDTRS